MTTKVNSEDEDQRKGSCVMQQQQISQLNSKVDQLQSRLDQQRDNISILQKDNSDLYQLVQQQSKEISLLQSEMKNCMNFNQQLRNVLKLGVDASLSQFEDPHNAPMMMVNQDQSHHNHQVQHNPHYGQSNAVNYARTVKQSQKQSLISSTVSRVSKIFSSPQPLQIYIDRCNCADSHVQSLTGLIRQNFNVDVNFVSDISEIDNVKKAIWVLFASGSRVDTQPRKNQPGQSVNEKVAVARQKSLAKLIGVVLVAGNGAVKVDTQFDHLFNLQLDSTFKEVRVSDPDTLSNLQNLCQVLLQ
ncbi:hypothetical protein MP228_009591 [Amoeboaphelidium protococcarum]|nr:hypothetical protein MP228_009591 [Amoeboaphelidium protococcarum]